MRHAALGILSAISLVLLASPARADSALVLIDPGTADLAVESLVRMAAEDGVHRAGFELAPLASADAAPIEALAACAGAGAECAAQVLEEVDAEAVLFLALTAGGDDAPGELAIRARLYEVASGRQLAVDQRLCDRCADADRLAAFVEGLTVDVFQTAAAAAAAPAPVPEPGPAPEPAPPRTAELAPAPGAPATPAERPRAPGRPFATWKYVALGAGLGALATGATFVALDGPRIDDGVRQPDERATRTEGFVALGVGAGLVATGALLWVADQRAAERQQSLRAGVAPTEGGLAISLGGSF